MVALGVSWSWVIVLVGVLAAVFLAGIAIVGDLPMVILMVLTALAGASTVVFGLMLVVGVIDLGDLDSAATTQAVDDDWWWYAISILVAAVGIGAQFRAVESLATTMRQQWADDGGRQLRAG
jgi:ABC-type phosphate transport system permease subunit